MFIKKSNLKILCTICARKGSKGVKNKNLKKLGNLTLIEISLNQANKSKVFNKVVFSTDSKKIIKIAKKNKIFYGSLRPKHLSNDHSSKLDVIRHITLQAEKFFFEKYDIICDLDVSSPLRSIADIKKCINIIINKDTDNVITGCVARKNPYFNMIEKKKNSINLIKRKNKTFFARQSAPKVYEMNASIYVWKRKALFSKKPIFRKKTSLYIMPFERSVDIDSVNDYKIVKMFHDSK